MMGLALALYKPEIDSKPINTTKTTRFYCILTLKSEFTLVFFLKNFEVPDDRDNLQNYIVSTWANIRS